MKIVLKKNSLQEASKRNITSTLSTLIVRKAAHALSKEAEWTPGKRIVVDISEDVQNLIGTSKKFNKIKNLKNLVLNLKDYFYSDSSGSANSETITLNLPEIFLAGGFDKEIYDLITKKQKPTSEEEFNQQVQKATEDMYEKHVKKYPNTSLQQFIQYSVGKYRPKYTPYRKINDKNIARYKKDQLVYFYITNEKIKEVMDEKEPGPKRIGRYYNALKSANTEQKVSRILSTISHEGTHVRHLTVDKYEKYLQSLFQDKSYLLLSDRMYDSKILPYEKIKSSGKNMIGNFHYLSRPIEIDARIAEYRLLFQNLKQENSKTAPEQLFNDILKRETLLGVSYINQNMNVIDPHSNLRTEEMRTKCLYQFFYQMSKTHPEIFNSTPEFSQKLEELSAKVDQINSDIERIYQLDKYPFDKYSRADLMKGFR
jgi:hypothetical protein